jgi:hypothetical protein
MLPVIYILAEERSGSTWVQTQIASKLGRYPAYIEIHSDEQANLRRLEIIRKNPDWYSNTDKVYRTHIFPIINALTCRPMYFRTTRRNTFDQMMSYFLRKKLAEKTQLWAPFLPTYRIGNVLKGQKITLTEAEVKEYQVTKAQRDSYWSSIAVGQTIYYEDLFQGVELYGLDITLKFEKPLDNREVIASHFTNYEEIKRFTR